MRMKYARHTATCSSRSRGTPLAGGWRAALPQLAALALMILLASLSWIMLGALLANGKILNPQRIPRAGAVVLAGFAVMLLLGTR